jgi:hypothetical protein
MSFDLTSQQLESLFEFYEQNHPVARADTNSGRPSRSYHAGRIYGTPGQYGDQDMEDRYQAFISNNELVNNTFEEYIDILENSVPAPYAAAGAPDGAADGAADGAVPYDNYMASNYYASIYDTIRFEGEYSDEDDEEEEEEPKVVMRIIARPTPLEEGEIVEENDVYPNDLLDPEPFIRAPVISAQSAEIMADEFAENYDDDYDEEDYYNEKDPYDAILERTQDPHAALREWEESDWVRNHPDPMISRIYVQATDRRYR